ncbi:hypothetical protein Clacol_003579 [Clathrus columnatus]|uniref:Uncharacterized protein n=1 Tax=Clathrus columnatus TaxID=1419009 RepID=A0AAV5A778_9AGAM|nr:hypothetical protein Clacol_003579 [Clathrus columnatus]
MYNCVIRFLKYDTYLLFRNSFTTRRLRHSLCSLAATNIPGIVIPEYTQGLPDEKIDPCSHLNQIVHLPGNDTNNTPSTLTAQFHLPSGISYIPYAQKLIEGISALDGDNKIWSLVHELVLNGRLSPTKCPEFVEFEHVVRLNDFSLALSTLFWKTRHITSQPHPLSQDIQLLDVETEESTHNLQPPSMNVPTWLSVYMLSTTVKTKSDAAKSLNFCLLLLDTTPNAITANLLLLSMCSLVRFHIINQIPALLNVFYDIVLSSLPSQSNNPTPTTSPELPGSLVIFQCNVLLTLLSQLPQSSVLGKSAARFLQQMQAANVHLETDTAKRLLDANFATQEMASLITNMLQNQNGLLKGIEAPDIHIHLARFYTKRRDLTRSLKYMEETKAISVDKHLRTYLRAFQDTTSALAYAKEANGISGPYQDKDVFNRPVYVSLLRSAANSHNISTESFLDMFNMIRDQFDNDKRLYTIALIGLIRRRAFQEARVIWDEWVTNIDRLRSVVDQLQTYLSERQKKTGDAQEIRETLGWDKESEFLAKRKLRRLQIDSDALVLGIRAVSGPKPNSLLATFLLMEKYSHSTKRLSLVTSRVVNCFMNRAVYFRRPDVVFKLWDMMEEHYGVNPSLGSLHILLRASRTCASISSSMQHFVPKWLRRNAITLPLNASLNEQMTVMLNPAYTPDISWYNWEPWRITRYIFREKIMFQNWPKLKLIEAPALAIRGDAATSSIDALREAELHRQMKNDDLGHYYQLLPDQQTFKQYVLMLGRVQRSSEIPEVLTWMKWLGVQPTKLTLSLFLALWSQVGLESPADEVWGIFSESGGHGGEYGKLILWLENWLGKDNVPTDREILEAFKYIDSIESKESVLY